MTEPGPLPTCTWTGMPFGTPSLRPRQNVCRPQLTVERVGHNCLKGSAFELTCFATASTMPIVHIFGLVPRRTCENNKSNVKYLSHQLWGPPKVRIMDVDSPNSQRSIGMLRSSCGVHEAGRKCSRIAILNGCWVCGW